MTPKTIPAETADIDKMMREAKAADEHRRAAIIQLSPRQQELFATWPPEIQKSLIESPSPSGESFKDRVGSFHLHVLKHTEGVDVAPTMDLMRDYLKTETARSAQVDEELRQEEAAEKVAKAVTPKPKTPEERAEATKAIGKDPMLAALGETQKEEKPVPLTGTTVRSGGITGTE